MGAPDIDYIAFDKLRVAGDNLFMSVQICFGFSCHRGVWRSDGTAQGTALVTQENFVNCGFNMMERFNSRLVFSESCGASELWVSDGTESGTGPIANLAVPGASVVIGDWLYFVASQPFGKGGIWKTDGTSAGTVRVLEPLTFRDAEATFASFFYTNYKGMLFFAASNGKDGMELWKSDGTTTGTVQLKDIVPGSESSSPAYFHVVNNLLFFVVFGPPETRGLWVTDGTSEGTRKAVELWRGPQDYHNYSGPLFLNSMGNILYFSATDGVSGPELWKLDTTQMYDADNDGTPNNVDPDDDNDLIPDTYEFEHNLNPNLIDDVSDKDSDGLDNLTEFNLGTAASIVDTDADGVNDKQEVDSGRNPLFKESNLLQIRKIVNLISPATGIPVEYRVTLNNIGTTSVFGIHVKDLMPTGMRTPNGMGPFFSQGTYNPASGVWEVGEIRAARDAVLTFPAIANQFVSPQCFVNEAMVTDFAGYDPKSDAISAYAPVFVGGVTSCAHLKISVTPEIVTQQQCNGGVTSNNRIAFNVSIKNAGPDIAQNVTIKLSGNYKGLSEPYIGERTTTLSQLTSGQTSSVILTWILPCGQSADVASYTLSTTTDTKTSTDSTLNITGSFNIPATGAYLCSVSANPATTSPADNAQSGSDSGGGGGGGCFIATAAYGSYMHPYVMELRKFRDDILAKSSAGRRFISIYYEYSPPIADLIDKNGILRMLTRLLLMPIVFVVIYPSLAFWLLILMISVIMQYRDRRVLAI